MIKYDKENKCGIKIEQIPLDILKKMDYTPEQQENIGTLFWAEDLNNIQLLFYSNTKQIQALEFMDYLVQNYARVQGDAKISKSNLTSIILQAMMLDFEAQNTTELLEKIIEMYFSSSKCIYANDFAKQNKNKILEMPQYAKKKIPWAYVKTTDIMKSGDKFYLKSIENQSKLLLEASDDIYVMVGCRGEVYHITKEKFEKTYDPTEEQLDIFQQMISYLPEVEHFETGEFITLDEIAHLCYPKSSKGIYAIPLESRTKIFNPYNNGEYFLGQEGDYMAIRHDDLSDIYIIQKDIFHETYELVYKREANDIPKTKIADVTLFDIEGNPVHLMDFIGKPVILNFWASWSEICQSELSYFNNAYIKYGNDVHFLMVNMTDASDETMEIAKAYIKNQGFTFPIYFDTEMNATITYQINSVPTTYFIDANGYAIGEPTDPIDCTTLQTKIDMLLSK